ncbi:hypothetical protein BJY04DRAFT_205889 [Aspergillus karnatakaensis]|uniref:F-box protein n=1 Tax=Aspergillus karnatakaensis TaxID=1810916 RepID=UPI003CCD5E8F
MQASLDLSNPGLGSGSKAGTEIPPAVTRRLLEFVPKDARRSLRLTCKSWARAIDEVLPLSLPTANTIPSELLAQIFHSLSPRDFDNARRTCSRWMRASLNERLLESMLKRAGWWDSWRRDNRNRRRKTNVERSGFLTTSVVDFSQLSRDSAPDSRAVPFSTPFTGDDDMSPASSFHVSNCGSYLLVISGRTIYVYQLLTRRTGKYVPLSAEDLRNTDIATVACINCPVEVLSAAIDTSTRDFTVAALMAKRLGMICDLLPIDWQERKKSETEMNGSMGSTSRSGRFGTIYSMKMASRHFYYNLCSTEDPPRSVSICPGYRCVAFGSGSGIELRWVDKQTNKDCRKHLPMSQPTEILHFMPNRPDNPLEFRLISSLASPGVDGCGCENLSPGETRPSCPFHMLQDDVQTFSRWAPEQKDRVGLVRTTQCHHYRAIPVNDGVHVLFVEPRSGFLCVGSDAPIDGPTSLTRALVCVPPPLEDDISDGFKDTPLPMAFAAGSDLNWGLRVIAAYGDRLVFYSVPLDVFNLLKKERERQGDGVMADSDLARDFFLNQQRGNARRGSIAQNQNGDWEFLLSISYRPTAMMWPFKIYGKEIGRVQNVVELALQSSHGGARIWAFSASGESNIIDVDTFTSTSQQASDIPCKSFTIGADGRIASAQLVNRSEHNLIAPDMSRKRKQAECRADFIGRHMLRLHSSPAMLHGRDASAASDLKVSNSRRESFAAQGRRVQPEAVY